MRRSAGLCRCAVARPTEIVSGYPSSSMVTICSHTDIARNCPSGCVNNMSYYVFAIVPAECVAATEITGWAKNTLLPGVNVGMARTN